MSLKAILDSVDGLPEAVQALYAKGDDGKYHLQVEGMVSEATVTGLKTNRDALLVEKKRLLDQVKAFDGLDAEKAREALAKLQELEDKKLMAKGEFDKLLEQRTERMKADHANQVKALTDKLTGLEQELGRKTKQLAALVVDGAIAKAAAAVGSIRKGAMSDVLARARGVWSLNDKGQAVALNPDGTVIYGKDGVNPLTPDEWARGLLAEAPHLWEESQGGGATPGTTAPGAGPIKLTAAQAKDVATYQRARAEAEKSGRSLEIGD